jgi:N-acetylmuramoyl-L-alanine amidase
VRGSNLVDRYQASPSHEQRAGGMSPRLLVLHYTGMASGQIAADWLCNPASRVSCHYLIDVDGTIIQMVDEDRRAWHAGTSNWHGEIDINSASIGIEIQNLGHSGGCPEFPKSQMQRLAVLCLDIMKRHHMKPQDVVAHSDVAPGRKIDPGDAFDWAYLAACGIGQMVIAAGDALPEADLNDVQNSLARLGYGIEVTGQYDARTRIVIEAVQRRYRRTLVNGKLDVETQDVLRRLLAIQPVD